MQRMQPASDHSSNQQHFTSFVYTSTEEDLLACVPAEGLHGSRAKLVVTPYVVLLLMLSQCISAADIHEVLP